MKQIQIDIPENLLLDERETKRFLAAKLYESGRLSLGQASKLAELSSIAFSEILSDYDVSLINYSADEITKDVARF
jgi:predicted HTH domain antitoxin